MRRFRFCISRLWLYYNILYTVVHNRILLTLTLFMYKLCIRFLLFICLRECFAEDLCVIFNFFQPWKYFREDSIKYVRLRISILCNDNNKNNSKIFENCNMNSIVERGICFKLKRDSFLKEFFKFYFIYWSIQNNDKLLKDIYIYI